MMKFTRRDFIHSGCTVGAAALVSSPVDKAKAMLHRAGAAISTNISFNGGKSQVNAGAIQTGSVFPFINCFVTCQVWSDVTGGAISDPSILDANGYPTSIVNGGVNTVFFVPPQNVAPSDWILSWDSSTSGTTTVGPRFSHQSATGIGNHSFTIPAATMAANDTGNSGRISFDVVTTGVSNVHFYSASDAAAHAAALAKGQTWGGVGTKFIALLKAGNPGVIRWMGVQGTDATGANASNSTTWAHRTPTTYYTFNAGCVIPGICCGSTAGTGDTFTISGNGLEIPVTGGPTDKMQIICKLDHAGSTSANALSLNGTTPIPFLSSQSCTATTVAAGFSTLTYDAGLNGWLVLGRPGIQNGVPPEILTEMSYEAGAHPYFNMPYLSVDPVQDYIPSLAAYIKANYQDTIAPWMCPRFEGPNESWNGATNFFANGYSTQKEQKYWNTIEGGFYWYGRAMSLMGQAINAVYGSPNPKTQTLYQVIAGVQSSTSGTASASNPRLGCVRDIGFTLITFSSGSANIVATGNTLALNAPVQLNAPGGALPINFAKNTTYFVKTTGSTITLAATPGGTAITAGSAGSGTPVIYSASLDPAYNWATTVCCTNYWAPTTMNQGGEYLLAWDAYVTNVGNPTVLAANANTYVSSNQILNQFTGSISGTTLTVATGSTANFVAGSTITGAGVTYGTTIVSGSGSSWVITPSQTVAGPIAMNAGNLLTTFQQWAAWGRAFANPVTKLCNYEGGYSPDFATALGTPVSVQVSGATNANPCVLTLVANSTAFYKNGVGSAANFVMPTNGTWLQLTFPAPWNTLNGTYKVTASSTSSVTIALDATSQGAVYSGTNVTAGIIGNFNSFTLTISGSTATVSGLVGDPLVVGSSVIYSGAPFGNQGWPKISAFGTGTGGNGTYTISGGSTVTGVSATSQLDPWLVVNTIREAGKYPSIMQQILIQNYTDVTVNTLGGEFPSFLSFTAGHAFSPWNLFDPDIYTDPLTWPQWQGIIQFNH